jgi:acylphosphatase
MDEMTGQQAVIGTVTGLVQGVGYRYSTLRIARELGLRGWVRNAPDGSVETWAQGEGAALDEFIGFLRQGPRAARVRSVDLRPVEPDASLTGFDVRS